MPRLQERGQTYLVNPLISTVIGGLLAPMGGGVGIALSDRREHPGTAALNSQFRASTRLLEHLQLPPRKTSGAGIICALAWPGKRDNATSETDLIRRSFQVGEVDLGEADPPGLVRGVRAWAAYPLPARRDGLDLCGCPGSSWSKWIGIVYESLRRRGNSSE